MAEDVASNSGEEHIVMTARRRGVGHTCIVVERVSSHHIDTSKAVHVAGGQHQGIVINRGVASPPSSAQNGDASNAADDEAVEVPQLWLEFKVFLKNAADGTHTQESRKLKFWFKVKVDEATQMRSAQDFFKELVSPCDFPRDYVGFIKKVMKLLQHRFPEIQKIEVELKQLKTLQPDQDLMIGIAKEASKRPTVDISIERLLEIVERAYPNAVTVEEIARTSSLPHDCILAFLKRLEDSGMVRRSEDGASFSRVTSDEHKVKRVRQMPAVTRQQQPTIAIITAQFCEKVAVDFMIDNKDTFVRYKTEGESNIYTLGNIGQHRVVATKLPAVGHQRGAMIAAGNTTTRLLGTFQNVDYVILVGCGGGVPHYTDYSKHVRLGDVVISDWPEGIPNGDYVYMFAERVQVSPSDESSLTSPVAFSIKSWSPPENKLQAAAKRVLEKKFPWESYISCIQSQVKGASEVTPVTNGDVATLSVVGGEVGNDFSRPCEESDKLYMCIGGNDVIEVGHPCPPENVLQLRTKERPLVHFGAVASGEMVSGDDGQRQEFAAKHGILAYDSEFDSVIESIYGNRKDNYVIIRGIADYRDGSQRRDWQNYAALSAAAFMKALIEHLPVDC